MFGWLSSIFTAKGTASAVDAIGSAVDKVFTSDEEREQAKATLEKLAQRPHILQAEITKLEASHRSPFVAGWRPAIGWVCAIGLMFPFVINPILQWTTGDPGPVLPTDALINLVLALIGLGGLRTAEKIAGKAK